MGSGSHAEQRILFGPSEVEGSPSTPLRYVRGDRVAQVAQDESHSQPMSFGRSSFLWLLFVLFSSRLALAGEMRVAVMEFTTATQDAELSALGKGLQSMLTTDLSVVKTLGVIERERLKEVRKEIELTRSAGFDRHTVAKLGKLVGATHLFVGSFTVLGEVMRLDGRLIEVGTGKVLLAEQNSGEKALFFELEQQLVQKVIASLGVKVAPKEKALLARPHTADFEAFHQFSAGLQSFDEGRLEEAMKALGAATEIDKDFRLAALTLEEYERLAAQIRAKAEASGHVEDEFKLLEKNKAIAAETALIKKQWTLLEATTGNSVEAKIRRVAIACALASLYGSKLGFQNRGPVNSADLAAAGFDDFSLLRTSEALFARAWAEAPDVFPRITPLCIRLNSLSSSNDRPVEELLQYEIDEALKLFEKREVILSYMANNSVVDAAAEKLHLGAAEQAKLWQHLFALAQKLPGLTDEERTGYESKIAEHRRAAGDFDGSTQMFAAASSHSKDSHRLKTYADEIDKNKSLKQIVSPSNVLLREYFLLKPNTSISELERLARPESKERLGQAVESGRGLSKRSMVLFGGVPTWYLSAPSFGARVRSGPRTSRQATGELQYLGEQSSREATTSIEPVLLSTSLRGRKLTVKTTIDGNAMAGVAFAMHRVEPEGGIDRQAPAVTIAHAVLVDGEMIRLVRLTRDGEHRVAMERLAQAQGGKTDGPSAFEVVVETGKISVRAKGQQASFPWKPPASEAEGFVGFVFGGVGRASLSRPVIAIDAR